MARFKYKMQNILELKEKIETEAKIGLTLANQRLNREEDKLKEIRTEILNYENELREVSFGKLNITKMKSLNDGIKIKKNEESMQLINIKNAEKNVQIARKKLQDVMVERKTHEVLKQKAFEEFLQELSQEEKKEIDELVSYQYNKNEEGE